MVYWRRNYAVHWTGTWLPLGLGLMWYSASGACILYIYIYIHAYTLKYNHKQAYTCIYTLYTYIYMIIRVCTTIYNHIRTYTYIYFIWCWLWVVLICKNMIPVSLQVHLVTKYHLIHTGADLFEQTITLSLLLHVGAEVCPLLHWKHAFSLSDPMNTGCLGLWHMHTRDKLR